MEEDIGNENINNSTSDSSKFLTLKIKTSVLKQENIDEQQNILEKISKLGFAERFKNLGKKIHEETFNVLKEECQKLIAEMITNELQDPEEFKKKAIQDSLKKSAVELKKYLQELKNKHEMNQQKEIAKLEDKLKEEFQPKLESERIRGEKCLSKALEEAQEHFRNHLKTAIQQAQEKERKIGEENIRKMKREFEDRLDAINHNSYNDKQKSLNKLQNVLQKDIDETVKQVKVEEENNTKSEVKNRREEYEKYIRMEEMKADRVNKHIQQLAQQLKQTIHMKSLIDSEIMKVRQSLSQFIKLANRTETDPVYKAKVGEILRSANVQYV
ncbi:uncharacterized protein PF3D7_1120000-like [Centruroides vittatus]|uniref:uncharacterized protein PF3D7_1120000-like n=1 Tax=Centruroides vittatus TaxID=120091 RepID=UPI00350F8A13